MENLTPKQLRAVDLLIAGSPVGDVAAAVAVDRVTLWRWRQSPDFEAALNGRRQELWQGSIEHLRSLVPRALDALEAELAGNRKLRAAETILRLAGFDDARKGGLGVRPSGPTDPAVIARERERNRALEELLSL